jgi:hypothetical protein
MPIPLPRSGLAAALLLAAGCATEGPFPSLEPRPIEQQDPLAEPVRTPPVVAPDPVIRARAAELLARAQAGERDFDAAYGSASVAARTAGGEGSESWIEAQQAISRAEAARAPSMTALAELDRLAVERAGVPTDEEDFAAIRSALAEAERIARGQQQRLDALRASVRN